MFSFKLFNTNQKAILMASPAIFLMTDLGQLLQAQTLKTEEGGNNSYLWLILIIVFVLVALFIPTLTQRGKMKLDEVDEAEAPAPSEGPSGKAEADVEAEAEAEAAAKAKAAAEEEALAKAKAEAEAEAEAAAKAKAAADAKPDNLTRIEGIGPKISELLQQAGIKTFAQLSQTDVNHIKSILEKAGSRYKLANPQTWPEQAKLAATEKWDELDKLQDNLKGGKTAT